MQSFVLPESTAKAFLVFRHAEVFLAVCQFRSFAQAAKHLHLSTSAVSQAVAHFESELGVTLFDRSTRPVVLTPEAMVLARELVQSCSTINSAARSIQIQSGKRPALMIGLIESACQSFGADLIEKLTPDFSKITVLTNSIDSLVNKLKAGHIELFVSSHGIESDSALTRARLYAEPLVAALPKTLITDGKALSATLLSQCGLPLIWAPEGTHNRHLMDELFAPVGWIPPKVLEVESQSVALELVVRGIGWYVTQPLCLYPARNFFNLMQLAPFKETKAMRELYLISLKGHKSPLIPVVQDFVRGWLARQMPIAFAGTAVSHIIAEAVNGL